MPTNEERRRISARLREIAPGSDWPDMVAEACGLKPQEMSNSFHEFTGELCDRLADLIEPEPERTCRNVAEQGIFFECSECGAKTVDAVGNYTQEYCAACGRRVQDAD